MSSLRKNTLREKLDRKESVFGTWLMTNSLDNAEILSHTGVDFIMIDAEHGSMGIESAGRMISVIRGSQATPLLRVAGNEKSLIKKGLDTGAEGVMIPMVNTKEEAEKVVSFCKYPLLAFAALVPEERYCLGLTMKNIRIIMQKLMQK